MENIISYKDFNEQQLKNKEHKQFEEHIKEFYHGDFYMDSKIIKKNGKTFLRVFAIAGKY